MTLTNQNFTRYAGDDVPVNLTITKPDLVTPIDLTGATVKWALKSRAYATVAISKDTSNGITITDAVNGKVSFSLSAADTQNLSGDYYHVAKIVDAQGNPYTVETGMATFLTSGI